MRRYWGVFYAPPEGTTDNGSAASFESSRGGVTSGTASDAMIAAATAASSAADASAGAAETTPVIPAVKTETPTIVETAPIAGDKKGAIPFDRHETALKNARTEAATEALKSFAWAQGLDPNDVQNKMAIIARMQADPKAFLAEYQAAMKEQGLVEEPEEAMPEADIVDPSGKLKTYTDATLNKIWEIREKRLEKRLLAEMRPALEFAQTEHGRREQAEADRQRGQLVSTTMAGIRANQHFPKGADGKRDAAGEAQILEYMRAIPAETRKAVGPVAALYMAFETYKEKHVYPNIQATAAETIRLENAKKAAASGGAHPVDQGGEGKKPELRNQNDLAAHMERLARGEAPLPAGL